MSHRHQREAMQVRKNGQQSLLFVEQTSTSISKSWIPNGLFVMMDTILAFSDTIGFDENISVSLTCRRNKHTRRTAFAVQWYKDPSLHSCSAWKTCDGNRVQDKDVLKLQQRP